MKPLLIICILASFHSTFAQDKRESPLEVEDIRAASKVAGLNLEANELKMMLDDVRQNLHAFQALRARSIPNSLPPAFELRRPIRSRRTPATSTIKLPSVNRPKDLNDLAFADIRTLQSLIKSRQVTCLELTKLFLSRLKRLDPQLHFVAHYCEARALKRANELDTLLTQGKWLGPLHGIPYGAKDLLSARGSKTSWGAAPYKDQVLDEDAAVITHLEAAGAVLIAKLSLGALAMGDVWYGGKTRSPWNPKQGSSGSSAGPASATAAGCVPFAIGSETLGSIISPSIRCGNSSLRPSLGVVETSGAMALSWSMDKLGPICRSIDDASLVFPAMLGASRAKALGYPFPFSGEVPLKGLRIGLIGGGRGSSMPDEVLSDLRKLGATITQLELPKYPTRAMTLILTCEAAAAFDELTRSNRDDLLTRQNGGAWPNAFRIHRVVPAVEYIQAQRLRTQLIRDTEKALKDIDVFVHAPYTALAHLNLTGHPSIVVPFGGEADKAPKGIVFSGRLYGEVALLAVTRAWQSRTTHHLRHPAWLKK